MGGSVTVIVVVIIFPLIASLVVVFFCCKKEARKKAVGCCRRSKSGNLGLDRSKIDNVLSNETVSDTHLHLQSTHIQIHFLLLALLTLQPFFPPSLYTALHYCCSAPLELFVPSAPPKFPIPPLPTSSFIYYIKHFQETTFVPDWSRKTSLALTTMSSGSSPYSEPPDAVTKDWDPWEFPRHHLKIYGILGEGCFGQVWKCEAINIDGVKGTSTVAVKTLKEAASDKEKKDLLQVRGRHKEEAKKSFFQDKIV